MNNSSANGNISDGGNNTSGNISIGGGNVTVERNYLKIFEQAAHNYSDLMLFTYSDIRKDVQARLAHEMGVTKDDLPTIRILNPSIMKKYKYNDAVQNITVESVGDFVKSVLNGTV